MANSGKALDSGYWKSQLALLLRGELNARYLGADDTGATAANAVAKLCEKKCAAAGLDYTNLSFVNPRGKVIKWPPGKYKITESKALLGSSGNAPTFMMSNLTILCEGTIFDFNPGAAGTMMENTYWQHIVVKGGSFGCNTAAAGSTFFHGINASGSASQNVTFENCTWTGPWKYGFHLEGDDNMSEFKWSNADISGIQNSGAFLYIPEAGATDQLLNYHFAGMTKFWSSSASLVDISKGGHVVIDNIDVSRWNDQNLAVSLFNLRGSTHAGGVTSFLVNQLRIEDFSQQGLILYSEWDNGNVTLRNVDQSSQVELHRTGGSSVWGTKYRFTINGEGPVVHITDSRLGGDVEIITNAGALRYTKKFLIENSTWMDRKRPSDVVKYTATGPGYASVVMFRNCRPEGYAYPLLDDAGTGLAVWESDIGWSRGGVAAVAEERTILLADPWGGPSSGTQRMQVHLPTPAMITGLEVLAPQGGTAGTTTVATSAGAMLATLASTTSAKRFGGALASPVYLATDAESTVTTTTTMASTPAQTRILIRGFW